MSAIIAGPPCRQCRRNEQECALYGGCCRGCTHWSDLDEYGHDLNPRPYRRPQREHGTEDAYLLHLENGTQPCTPCRRAHRQHRVQTLAKAETNPYLYDELYRECIPQRISRPPSSHLGPTAQVQALERQRRLWAGEFTNDMHETTDSLSSEHSPRGRSQRRSQDAETGAPRSDDPSVFDAPLRPMTAGGVG